MNVQDKIKQYIIKTGDVPISVTVSREVFADSYVNGELDLVREDMRGRKHFSYQGVMVKPNNSEPVNPLPLSWSAVRDGDDFKITKHHSRIASSGTLVLKTSDVLSDQLLHALLEQVLL